MLAKISRGFKSTTSSCLVLLKKASAVRGDRDAVELGGTRPKERSCTRSYKPNRTCLSTVFYLLIGASVLTTYTLWDFMKENSSKGTLESPSSYLTGSSGNSRSLRGLFDFSNVNSDLKNLFNVEPAVDQTNFRTQMLEQEKTVANYEREEREKERDIAAALPPAGHGPFSCTAKPICPEIDIPGLVGKRKLDLKDAPMVKTEELIFGSLAGNVRTAAKRANDNLLKKLVDPKTGNITHVDWLFDQVIESEAINISNYWYLPGGHWKPVNCLPRWKVAIIIPFRDRFFHLPIILRYLVPMLQRQLLDFSFFIVEQANEELFNRAFLMNVGFLEALNFTNYDCFVIHDVDHVPIDDRNYYGCSSMPKHFVSGADRWNYKLPYDNFFGAVTGLTKGNIISINGFPNVYWGWGGEDDEIWKRVKEVGLEITRHKGPIAYYDVIRHHHKSAPLAKERYGLLKSFKGRYKMDGLSDIVYPTPLYELHTLYTNISVNIQKIKPHYPMPGPNPVNKAELTKKLAGLAMKGKGKPPAKKAVPGVRKPDAAKVDVKKDPSPNAETGKEGGDATNEKDEVDGDKKTKEDGDVKPKEDGDQEPKGDGVQEPKEDQNAKPKDDRGNKEGEKKSD